MNKTDQEYGFVCTAGALRRQYVRACLDAAGFDYREHKGLLTSSFACTATRSEWDSFLRVMGES